MKKQSNIPDSDNVLRWARASHLMRDNDGNIIGCFPELFKLRPQDKGSVSVNWPEYYVGEDSQLQIKKSISDFRKNFLKGKKIPTQSAFTKLYVKELKKISKANSVSIRVVTEYSDSNKSHAGIRQLPQNNNFFFDDLCELAFNSHISAKNLED